MESSDIYRLVKQRLQELEQERAELQTIEQHLRPRGVISPEGRAKIAQAQRKRHAARRAALV